VYLTPLGFVPATTAENFSKIFEFREQRNRMADTKRWLALAWGVAAVAMPAWAQDQSQQTTDQKIQQLEQKVDALEKEVKAGGAGDPSGQSLATVSADYINGFTIRSKDGNFVLHIGADLQIDNRTYFDNGAGSDLDTIVIRRARPTIFGTVYRYVDFFIRPDFGQGTTALYDAYIQLNYIPWLQVRAGKFKPGVGLERLQNDDDTSFVERGLPSILGPQRDIGFQLGANLFRNRVAYQVGVFDGVPDNSIGTDTAVSDHRDYAGRLFLTPFAPNENALSGLGVGLGVEGGNTDGEALPSYKTFGQESFFTFASASLRRATEPASTRKPTITWDPSACWPSMP
jgi:phosphate-selective porin OprO/OprP